MAMKKADMEHHRAEYHARMDNAKFAERRGLFRETVQLALSAWPFIDGMMQYERRYESTDFKSIPAIDLILEYAPLLFDFQCLDDLENLLKDTKRIDRNTSDSLAARLADARSNIWQNHKLWSHLESNPDSREDQLHRLLGEKRAYWRSVTKAWAQMGVLRRTPAHGTFELALTTRLDEVVHAKCPSCGTIGHAPKAMFLELMTCPECASMRLFVLQSSEMDSAVES
jgi:hypothetical protein